jgi:P-type Cu+ transporter
MTMPPNPPTKAVARIHVTGMTCAACVRRVRHTLIEEPGVSAAEVTLGSREAYVTFDPDATNEKALVDAIRGSGYGAELAEEE